MSKSNRNLDNDLANSLGVDLEAEAKKAEKRNGQLPRGNVNKDLLRNGHNMLSGGDEKRKSKGADKPDLTNIKKEDIEHSSVWFLLAEAKALKTYLLQKGLKKQEYLRELVLKDIDYKAEDWV